MNALTVGQACKMLKLTPEALWALVASGDLETFQLTPRKLIVTAPSLVKYIALTDTRSPAAVAAARPRERNRWRGMLDRCENPRSISYRYYGARGITVCEAWHDFDTYYADIIRLIGLPPEGHSIDRINNDRGYEPGNVRWATADEQQANNRPKGMAS